MQRLQRIVKRLRRECPWDRRQTVSSVRHSVLEEAYELSEAIRERDYARIAEEAGDHIFVGLFIAQILEDTGQSSVRKVLDRISDKLVRRHPHVFVRGHDTESGRFGSCPRDLSRVRTAGDVIRNWDRIKEKEKGHSILDGVPKALPALQRAGSIQSRAKRVGFDWRDPRDVLAKVEEEIGEIRAELSAGRKNRARVREELGDLLFALVNMARHLGIDAEDALQRANTKFGQRFKQIERRVRQQGKRLEHCTLEELDGIWEDNKRRQRSRRK